MHTTLFRTFVAFSDNGRSILIKEKQFKPEGGDTISFILINPEEKNYMEFIFSNDFGIGDGSTPQKISKGKCKSSLKKLRRALTQYGFSGIVVCPDCCKKREWEKCISLSQSILDVNKQAFFGTKNNTLENIPFIIKVNDNKVTLLKENEVLLAWTPEHMPDNPEPLRQDYIKQMQAWVSPDMYQIVMFSFMHFNNHLLTDILFIDSTHQVKRITMKDLNRINV